MLPKDSFHDFLRVKRKAEWHVVPWLFDITTFLFSKQGNCPRLHDLTMEIESTLDKTSACSLNTDVCRLFVPMKLYRLSSRK